MSYKIIGDSCTDLPKELKEDIHISLIPLSIQIEEENIIDDETFDQKSFLKKMKDSKECPKSSCPSPQAYMKEFDYTSCLIQFNNHSIVGSHNWLNI